MWTSSSTSWASWPTKPKVMTVRYFLIAYNRPKGIVEHLEAFDNQADALGARFAREAGREGSDLELVVLGAASEDDLRVTHARYFKTISELTLT